jgi:hypothetical protein
VTLSDIAAYFNMAGRRRIRIERMIERERLWRQGIACEAELIRARREFDSPFVRVTFTVWVRGGRRTQELIEDLYTLAGLARCVPDHRTIAGREEFRWFVTDGWTLATSRAELEKLERQGAIDVMEGGRACTARL